jgi:hypothetical protein
MSRLIEQAFLLLVPDFPFCLGQELGRSPIAVRGAGGSGASCWVGHSSDGRDGSDTSRDFLAVFAARQFGVSPRPVTISSITIMAAVWEGLTDRSRRPYRHGCLEEPGLTLLD